METNPSDPRSCYYMGLLHNTIFFVIWWISDVLEARHLWYRFDKAQLQWVRVGITGFVLLQDTSDGPTVDYLQHHDFAMWSRTEFRISRLEELQLMDQCVMVSVKYKNQRTIQCIWPRLPTFCTGQTVSLRSAREKGWRWYIVIWPSEMV